MGIAHGKFHLSGVRAVCLAAAGAALSAGGVQHWSASATSTLLSDAANWDGGKSPVYGVAGGDSNLGGFKTGTYTLDGDLTANRLVFDVKNATATFDLGAANTLTLCGLDASANNAVAFGATKDAQNSTLRLTSGTIRIPWVPQPDWAYTNCLMKVPRESDGRNFRFVVDGADSRLKADRIELTIGNVCGLVVTNGGYAAGALTMGNGAVNGNYLLVSGEGSVYEFPANTKFTLATSVWAKNLRVEVTDGGQLKGLSTLTVGNFADNRGYGHVVAFRGAKTDQTLALTDKLIVGANGASSCSLEVTDGAHLTLASTTANNNRLWVATGASAVGNTVLVRGSGSLISGDTGAAWLVGQHGRQNTLHITDKGKVQTTNGITIGQGDSTTLVTTVNENALRVDEGGVLLCANLVIGNGKADGTERTDFNRADILSGGAVTNSGTLNVGVNVNAASNVLHLAGGEYVATGASYIGRKSDGNALSVEAGGRFITENSSLFVGENAATSGAGNAVTVVDGGYVQVAALNLNGDGAGLTVSNGTLNVRGNVQLPVTDYGTAPVVTIAGAETLIYAGNAILIDAQARLNFTVPAGGYTQPPLQTPASKNITIANLGAATIDVTRFGHAGEAATVLARAGGTLKVDAASLTLLNDAVAGWGGVRVRGKDLVLWRKCGTMLTIR